MQEKDAAKQNKTPFAGSIGERIASFFSSQIGNDYRALFWNVTTNFFIVYFGEIVLEIISWVLLGSREYDIYENIITSEMFICIVSLLIARGTSACAAVAKGANDGEEYNRCFTTGVSTAIVTGIVIAIVMILNTVLSADGGIRTATDTEYLAAVTGEAFNVMLLPVFYVCEDFVYLSGDRKRAFLSSVIYGFGIILISILFSKTGMGVASLTIGRSICMLAGILVLIKSLHRSKAAGDYSFRLDLKYVIRLVRDGAPIAIGYLAVAIWTVVYDAMIAGRGSDDYLYFFSGNTIIIFYVFLFLMIFSALVTFQAGPVAGKGNPDKTHEIMRRILVTSIGFGLVSGIILFFYLPFTVSGLRIPDTGEADVILKRLRFSALFAGAYPILWSLIQYFSITRQQKKSYMLIGGIIGFYLLMGATSLIGNDEANNIIWIEFAIMPAVLAVWGWLMFRHETEEKAPDEGLKDKKIPVMAAFRLSGIKTILIDSLYTVVIIGIMAVILMGSYQVAILPDVSNTEYFCFENRSKVVANDGVTVLADNYFPKHELCESMDEAGPYLGSSVIAREDERFYSHHGVDYKGIVRGAYSFLAYGSVQGGSTITMQLLKNTILSNTGQMRTIVRKISEVLLAIRMEKCYSKDEILCMYLNNVNFGKGYYGVKSAAHHYFRKDPAELSLAEAVSLTCLSQHPNDYEMAQNSEFALKLRNLTLDCMARCGFISEEECEEASGELIDWNPYEVIINHSNVTPTLKSLPVIHDGDVYMSAEDVSRYLDESLCIRAKEGFLSTFGLDKYAVFDLKTGAAATDDIIEGADYLVKDLKGVSLLIQDGEYFLPVSRLSELYGIDVTADENALTIISHDRALKSAVVNEDSYIRYVYAEDSYAVGTVSAGAVVFVQDTEGDIYEGWSRIRTEDHLTGYVKSSALSDETVIREAETKYSAGSNEGAGTVRVMIPEGCTIDETIKILAASGVSGEAELMEAASYADFGYSYTDGRRKGTPYSLEGFLFPDTYEFYKRENATSALKRLVDNFDMKMSAHRGELESSPYGIKDIVIIASIIEKEAGAESERPKIASVIYNRLKSNMTLGMETTLIYAAKVHGLNELDITIDSPYNTYLYEGLPAGAICNPSEASIAAALNPEDTDYMVFAAGKDGRNRFYSDYNDFIDFVDSEEYGGSEEDVAYMSQTVRVMIPEGCCIDDIIKILAESGVSSEEELRKAASDADFGYSFTDERRKGTPYGLEGFLFPDTYEFYRGENAEQVLGRMVDNFNNRIKPYIDEIESSSYDLKDTIIIASIVEKETDDETERRLVASVICNRLKRGMPLENQIVQNYADSVPGIKDADNSYNTYTKKGLPPGAVSNPGESAIRAVIRHPDTDYYYYASGTDGRKHFFRDYKEYEDFIS